MTDETMQTQGTDPAYVADSDESAIETTSERSRKVAEVVEQLQSHAERELEDTYTIEMLVFDDGTVDAYAFETLAIDPVTDGDAPLVDRAEVRRDNDGTYRYRNVTVQANTPVEIHETRVIDND